MGQFPGHETLSKATPGAIKACVMLMVKENTVHITRLENIEEPATSFMWFKIKTQDNNFVLAAWYRQWTHPEIIKHHYTNGVDGEVERLESFQKQIKK